MAWTARTRENVKYVTIILVAFAMVLTLGLILPEGRWNGLGQWVGGIGALLAAIAALHIARHESARRDRQDRHRREICANQVVIIPGEGLTMTVRNSSPEPMRNIYPLTLTGAGLVVGVDFEGIRTLLPDSEEIITCRPLTWDVKGEAMIPEVTSSGDYVVEFKFDDMAGDQWHRYGTDPPTRRSN